MFTSNDDNPLSPHENGDGSNPKPNGNAWILDGQDPDAAKISLTFMTSLKSHQDPRLIWISTVCADPNNTGDMGDTTASLQLGQPNGFDNNGGSFDISHAPNWPGTAGVDDPVFQHKYSIVNRYTFAKYTAPTFFLTNAETQLLLAEAAQRGWISGNAADYYNAGVTAAIMQLNQTGANLSSSQAAAYLANNPYNPANGIEMINYEYWVTTFMDEYEAFANWRRSGFPNLTPVPAYPGNVTNGTIPRRFTYPITEAATNGANYNAAVSGLNNGDKMTSRVWWDKQ